MEGGCFCGAVRYRIDGAPTDGLPWYRRGRFDS